MSIGTKTITLFKAICLALIAVCLATLVMSWLGTSITGVHAGISVFATGVKGEYTSFWSVMLIINAVLFILLSGLAVYGLLKDKNTLLFPLAVVGFLMFFLAVFQRAFIKNDNDLVSMGMELHVGRGAWLMLFFSLLALGAAILDNLANGKRALSFSELNVFGLRMPTVSRSAMGTWTCPTCGAVQAVSQRFCDRCGTQKPEPPRCPGCGKLCRLGEAFCADCGTKL